MRLLNVGCGGQRPQDEHWWNLDNLRTQLKEGTPERKNLDAEPRYVEWNLLGHHILPFERQYFDGILLQHVIEHFDCHEAVKVLGQCREVLKPGGLILVTVPDAEYFLSVYDIDTKDRAVELFGEPIHDDGFDKFFDYALFRHDHKQVLTDRSLRCLMIRSGFKPESIKSISRFKSPIEMGIIAPDKGTPMAEISKQLTRRKFSLEMSAVK